MQKLLASIMAFFTLLPFATWGFGQENAYLAVFKAVVQEKKLTDKKYLAINLGNVKLADTAKLEKAIKAYCIKHNITLLPYDYDWLVEEGYIEVVGTLFEGDDPYDDWRFANGALTGFYGEKLTRNSLVTGVSVHSRATGPTSGESLTYVVKRFLCMWTIIETATIVA